MNESPWSILAEFTHIYMSDSVEQTSGSLMTAVQHLSLSDLFVERLSIIFTETLGKHAQRVDETQTTTRVQIRILLNCMGLKPEENSASWGFFFIETDQTIELYLYQDQT